VISFISYIFPATKRSIYRRPYLQIRRFSNPSCPIQSTKRLQSSQSHFCSESSPNANHEDGERRERERGFNSQGLRWKYAVLRCCAKKWAWVTGSLLWAWAQTTMHTGFELWTTMPVAIFLYNFEKKSSLLSPQESL